MKTTITLIAAALTATLSATSYAPPKNREVASPNGKFKLHVNVESGTHKITGEFASGVGGWEFKHDAGMHQFFVSDDGKAAAVVNWAWCGGFRLELDKPAVVIYSGARPGMARSYTYTELSKPRERNPDEIGPIGDFWRIWRGDATIKGNVLTIHVEGGKPRVIDITAPKDLPPLEAVAEEDRKKQERSTAPITEEEALRKVMEAHHSGEKPLISTRNQEQGLENNRGANGALQAQEEMEKLEKTLRAREIKENEAQTSEKTQIDPAFLALKAKETAEIEASFPALKTLLQSITEHSQLKVLGNHFGLMGQTMQGGDKQQDQKTPEAKRAVEERRGGIFYVNPYKLKADDAESIKTIIRDIRSYSKTTDPLARAGFHSCYALVFETNGSVTEIQISTGNYKIQAFHKDVDIYSYLTPEADKKLHEILGKYGLP